MENEQNLSGGLAKHTIKATGKIFDNPEKPPPTAIAILIITLFALLTFLGNKAVETVFRKHIEVKKWDLFLIILTSIGFMGLSIASFVMMNDFDIAEANGTFISDSFLVTGILLVVLAVYIMAKGIRYFRKPVKYAFRQSILTSLEKEGWSQRKIQTLGEPLLVVIIGVTCFLLNPIASLGLIFCAISVWIHLLKDKILERNSLAKQVSIMNSQNINKDQFNEIK